MLRPAGRLFRLSDAHIDAITAAEATPIGDARGDTRVVDWATIAPGDESLEEISRRIRVHLFLQFERRWFTIYCEINLPRLIAHLELRLDEEGWPFTAADIAAEVCARQLRHVVVHSVWRGRTRSGVPRDVALPSGWTTLHELAEIGEAVIAERVDLLRAFSVPVPTERPVSVAPPERLVTAAEERIGDAKCRVTAQQLTEWVAHAFIALDREARQLLHLRDRRGLKFEQIAELLGVTRFEAGRRFNDAQMQLFDRVEGYWITVRGEAGRRPPPPPAKDAPILQLRSSRRSSDEPHDDAR